MSTQIRTGVIRVEVGDNKPLYDTHVNAIISLALMLLVCYQRPTGIEPISTVSKTDALTVMLRTLFRIRKRGDNVLFKVQMKRVELLCLEDTMS